MALPITIADEPDGVIGNIDAFIERLENGFYLQDWFERLEQQRRLIEDATP